MWIDPLGIRDITTNITSKKAQVGKLDLRDLHENIAISNLCRLIHY